MRRFFSLKLFSSLLFASIFFLCFTITIHYFDLSSSSLGFVIYAQDDGGSSGGDSGGGDSGSGDSGGDSSGGDSSGSDTGGADQSSDSGVSSGDSGDPGGDGQTEAPVDSSGGTTSEQDAPTEQQPDVGTGGVNVEINGNSVSFDQPTDVSSISIPSAGLDIPGDVGTTSIQGPEGMVATVTDNGDGTVSVSFSPPDSNIGNEVGNETITTEVGGDAQGGNNEGNTQGGGDTSPIDSGPPPCTTNCSSTPPAAFYQNLPVAYTCGATGGNPTIRTSWSSSSNFSDYYIYYLDSAEGILRGGWSTGGREYFDFTASSNLVSGHQYGFTVMAVNNAGYQTISDGGLWSHQKFGVFTTFPDCTPPTVTLSQISNICTAGGSSLAELGFSSPSLGIEAFHLDKNGVYFGSAFPASPSLKATIAPGESVNFTARVQVGGAVYGGSNTVTIRSVDCVPIAAPVITLTMTTQKGTFPMGGLPITVRQNEVATINWQIELADSAQASSNPNKAEWEGLKNKVSGSQEITTTQAGNYVLSLKAANVVGESAVSMQLNVLQYPAPYIQTTGGDVHSNETIYMTPP